MNTVRLWVLGLLLLGVVAMLGFSAEEPSLFPPFVSRIRTAVRDFQVKLTWTDSTDPAADYLVYRHTREIGPETFADAILVGEVPRGVESFIDKPPELREYFYAVLARGGDGSVHDVFIPFRNKTTRGVTAERLQNEQERSAVVTRIRAAAEGSGIRVEYAASRPNRNLLLFRGTSPLLTLEALEKAVVAKTVDSGGQSVVDFAVPGVPYYYALVDEELITAGAVRLASGENATVDFAEIPLGSSAPPLLTPPPRTARRTVPLPYYRLNVDIASGRNLAAGRAGGLPGKQALDPATRKAVDRLVSATRPQAPPEMRPTRLDIDKALGGVPDEEAFKTILDGVFAEGAWKTAATLIENFLTLPRRADLRMRAFYYLGQCLYFLGSYKKSFAAFLTSGEAHYVDSRPWMDAILVRLAFFDMASGL